LDDVKNKLRSEVISYCVSADWRVGMDGKRVESGRTIVIGDIVRT
jgi:hypothetical protein